MHLWGIDLLLTGEYASLLPTHTALWMQKICLSYAEILNSLSPLFRWKLLSIPMVILVLSVVASPPHQCALEGSLQVSTTAISLCLVFSVSGQRSLSPLMLTMRILPPQKWSLWIPQAVTYLLFPRSTIGLYLGPGARLRISKQHLAWLDLCRALAIPFLPLTNTPAYCMSSVRSA